MAGALEVRGIPTMPRERKTSSCLGPVRCGGSVWPCSPERARIEGRPRRTVETLIMPDETPADRQPIPSDKGPAREPLRELTLGRSRPSPDPPTTRPEPDTPADDQGSEWEPLAARCRAKAVAA